MSTTRHPALTPPPSYGTIRSVERHRVRLSDRELALIVSALRARQSGVSDRSAAYIGRLADRLAEMSPGNPVWRLGWVDVSASEHVSTPAIRTSAGGGRASEA